MYLRGTLCGDINKEIGIWQTMDDEEADLREQIFHNNVREQIVSSYKKVIEFLLNYSLNIGKQKITLLLNIHLLF